MNHLLAGTVALLVGYIPHALLGDRLGVFGDFVASTLVGGVAYVLVYRKLRELRG